MIRILTILTFVFTLLFSNFLFALDMTVNSALDKASTNFGRIACQNGRGTCILRDAIAIANMLSGDDTITIDLTSIRVAAMQPITLRQGNLKILATGGALVITGDSGRTTTIDANNSSNIFEIESGAELTFEYLTLMNGRASVGGAIYNEGILNINNSVLADNRSYSGANQGGALYNNCTLSTCVTNIENTTIQNNNSSNGGAIYNEKGSIFISGSNFSNNNGYEIYNLDTITLSNTNFYNDIDANAALYNFSGNSTIDQCSFTGGYNVNSIMNYDSILAVSDSQFSSGGIYSYARNGDAELTVEDSSVINSNTRGITQLVDAGYHAIVNIQNVTIDNSASDGMRLWNDGGSLTVTIEDSTISNNTRVGLVINDGSVVMSDSTIQSNAEEGMSINYGDVSLTQVNITNNLEGGIHNLYAPLTLLNTTISGNTGNGIFNWLAPLSITSSEITNNNNTLHSHGGGIYHHGFGGHNLSIIESTINGNSGTNGGGILVSEGASSPVYIYKSTISNNYAEGGPISCHVPIGGGGGLLLASPTIILNSTISGNSTNEAGGGIYVLDVAAAWIVKIINTTIANNSADLNDDSTTEIGGGIYNFPTMPGIIHVKNSILANNTDNTAPDCGGGALTSYNYNIITDINNCTITPSSTSITNDKLNTDPNLLPLDNYGGLTQTHAILSSSPALDLIPGSHCVDFTGVAIADDQRGKGRTDFCDSGSFEFIDYDGDGMPDYWEVLHGLNPYNAGDATTDFDGDTLDNLSEYNHQTNPTNVDSDGDGVHDNIEISNGTDPNDASSF